MSFFCADLDRYSSMRLRVHLRLALLAIAPWISHCTSKPVDELPPAVVPVSGPQAVEQPSNVFLPGDDLELFVKEDASLNGVYPVREGGYIVMPRAGRLQVAGMTREQVEPRVKDFLQKSQLTQATVIVERRSRVATGGAGSINAGGQAIPRILVYITGSVPRSGPHAIPVPLGKKVGVYEALLISGGLGKFAMTEKIEVFRSDSEGKRRRSVVDLKPIMKGQAEDPPISEGDIINVPEKVFGF